MFKAKLGAEQECSDWGFILVFVALPYSHLSKYPSVSPKVQLAVLCPQEELLSMSGQLCSDLRMEAGSCHGSHPRVYFPTALLLLFLQKCTI
jgi:hypothetical protein